MRCYRSKAINKYLKHLKSPSIDISGGDGTVSFIACGGKFNSDFDLYQSVGNLKKVHKDNTDMFDFFNENTYDPQIEINPKYNFDYNSDLKINLINKSKKLNFYKNHVLQDNNETQKFEDSKFNFIFSNSIYWIKNIDFFLTELYRISNKNCLILLLLKNNLQIDHSFRDLKNLSTNAKFILDRGRKETYPSLFEHEVWIEKLKNNNFIIEDCIPTFTKDNRHIVDVGLRPFAPLLIEMSQELDIETQRQIKERWINLCFELLDFISEPGSFLGFDDRPAEYLYVLRK